MKRFSAVLLIGVLTLLSACGGGETAPITPPPVTPPVTPPPVTPPLNPALVTPIGTNIGTPVTQTIGTAGGVVTLGKVTVSAPSGAFNGSSLNVQAITNTFNDTGQGIAISSDASWNKYLTVTFPIDPSDDSPQGLGLAVQQSDGSWRSLEPVKIDLKAGTVSAGLPPATEVSASRVRAQALDPTRVIKFERFYLKPESATVKVKGSQSFVPYAQVLERPKGCTLPPVNPDDELIPLPPKCWVGVAREYPFTNSKDNFARSWSVNGVLNGNATLGTITPSSGSGATYTAPDKKPSPDSVTVSFQSIQIDTADSVNLKASVKIIDDVIQSYVGMLEFSGSTYDNKTEFSGKNEITWKLTGRYPGVTQYEFYGWIQITNTAPQCSSVSGSVSAYGGMNVYDSGSYYFTFGTYPQSVTAQCGNPRKAQTVNITTEKIEVQCGTVNLPGMPIYTDISVLSDSGLWKSCVGVPVTASWDFKAK